MCTGVCALMCALVSALVSSCVHGRLSCLSFAVSCVCNGVWCLVHPVFSLLSLSLACGLVWMRVSVWIPLYSVSISGVFHASLRITLSKT